MEKIMFDTIIIGAGPAGISAALYTVRAGLDTILFNAGIEKSQLSKAHKIENFYGFPGGISGIDLYKNGIEQARLIGAKIESAEVVSIFPIDGGFSAKTAEKSFEAKSVIIATGNKRVRPNISGIKEFEGKGVSFCAVCDGFFYRKKRVAVIGSGNYAKSEASELLPLAESVSILTNGEPFDKDDFAGFNVDSRKISKIFGESKVQGIEFEDGEKIALDGVFVALGSAGAADFAKKLALFTSGDAISANEKMETNAKGIFVCGDAAGGLLQVSKAVCEGAKAGLSAIEFVRKSKG